MLPYEFIEQRLNYVFKNRLLLLQALTHRSYLNESKLDVDSYERLEFLGDSVLNFLVSKELFTLYPDKKEGDLSLIRSRLVSKQACVFYAQKLGIIDSILVAKGEKIGIERSKEGILADIYESLLAAIYLDGGMEPAVDFFSTTAKPFFIHLLSAIGKDYKALLQDYTLRNYKKLPEYEVLFEEGPDHQKNFLVRVFVDAEEAGRGRGTTKKQAEQQAAMEAVLYHGWQDEQTKTRL